MKFSGDLSQLEDARVEATLRASQVVRDHYAARNLNLTAEWKDQTLALPQVDWRDDAGRFSGTATWQRTNGHATFQARSTINLQSLLGSFGLGAFVDDFTFAASPLIEASGSATFGAPERQFEVIGKLTLRKLHLQKRRLRWADRRFRLGARSHDGARFAPPPTERTTQRRHFQCA